jgi:hypothetical protein
MPYALLCLGISCILGVWGVAHARPNSYDGSAFCGGLSSLVTRGSPWHSVAPSSSGRATCRSRGGLQMSLRQDKEESVSAASRIGRFMAVVGMASSLVLGNVVNMDRNAAWAVSDASPNANYVAGQRDVSQFSLKLAAGFPDMSQFSMPDVSKLNVDTSKLSMPDVSKFKLPDSAQLDQLMGKPDSTPEQTAAPKPAAAPKSTATEPAAAPAAPPPAQAEKKAAPAPSPQPKLEAPAPQAKSESAPSTPAPKPASAPSSASIPGMPNMPNMPGMPTMQSIQNIPGMPTIPQEMPTTDQVIDMIKKSRLPQPGEVFQLPTGV